MVGNSNLVFIWKMRETRKPQNKTWPRVRINCNQNYTLLSMESLNSAHLNTNFYVVNVFLPHLHLWFHSAALLSKLLSSKLYQRNPSSRFSLQVSPSIFLPFLKKKILTNPSELNFTPISILNVFMKGLFLSENKGHWHVWLLIFFYLFLSNDIKLSNVSRAQRNKTIVASSSSKCPHHSLMFWTKKSSEMWIMLQRRKEMIKMLKYIEDLQQQQRKSI